MVFVAVNSGNSRSDVQGYLDRVNVGWPAIVDRNRKFEEACGVGEISLRNIWQTAIVTPDGMLRYGGVEKLDFYLKQARWNIDPTGLPAVLRPAWRALEFGDLLGAVKLLNSARGTVEATDPSFRRLTRLVDPMLVTRYAEAEALDKADRIPEAYGAYQSIVRDFEGYPHKDVGKASVAVQRLMPIMLQEVVSSLDRSGKPAYETMHEAMVRLLSARMRSAGELAADGRSWEATKAYERILFHFEALDSPQIREVKAALKNLGKEDEVRKQLAARRGLDRALKKVRSADPKQQESGRSALAKLCEKYPGTEAALEAQAILSK